MSEPNPQPDLTTLTSTQALLEMGKVIEDSRKYFNDVCKGIGVQADGELAYTYIFTLTRDSKPGFWDNVWNLGSCPMEFDHHITNDEHHQTWVPKDGDVMPRDWAWHVEGHYTSKPIKNVKKILSADAQYIKKKLETARSNADGIANMQAEDFDAIAAIPTALGTQNQQLEALITTLNTADDDAQKLREEIEGGWSSESATMYASRIGSFKDALVELSEASDSMKGANVTVATHVGELMYAIMELWKARVEGMDEMASGFLGGAKNLVDLLKEPTVMGVVLKVIDVVGSVLEKMATADVEDRMKKLKDLGDMATKLQPIESAVTAAGEVSWPTMPTDTEWTPR